MKVPGWSAGRGGQGQDKRPRQERQVGPPGPEGVIGEVKATIIEQCCLSKRSGPFQKCGGWTGGV